MNNSYQFTLKKWVYKGLCILLLTKCKADWTRRACVCVWKYKLGKYLVNMMMATGACETQWMRKRGKKNTLLCHFKKRDSKILINFLFDTAVHGSTISDFIHTHTHFKWIYQRICTDFWARTFPKQFLPENSIDYFFCHTESTSSVVVIFSFCRTRESGRNEKTRDQLKKPNWKKNESKQNH